MRFPVDELAILRKPDLGHSATGIGELLEAICGFKEAFEPLECCVTLVAGDVPCLFIGTLDRER